MTFGRLLRPPAWKQSKPYSDPRPTWGSCIAEIYATCFFTEFNVVEV